MSSDDDRFHYIRLHEHPMGWGVMDAKLDRTVAYGDKLICAVLAELLNGKAYNGGLSNFGNLLDALHRDRRPK